MSAVTAHEGGHGAQLLALYDRALPQVYGYLVRRVGDVPTAEDLTSETFMAAVTAIERGVVDVVEVAWLVGIARHKLADHWRRLAREDRGLRVVAGEAAVTGEVDDPWEAHIDASAAQATLARLGAHHRGALVLRYVDGLPVKQVAELLHRTEHATEALLVRARRAFREQYEASATGGAPEGGGTDA